MLALSECPADDAVAVVEPEPWRPSLRLAVILLAFFATVNLIRLANRSPSSTKEVLR
jgi:hypothetical protein